MMAHATVLFMKGGLTRAIPMTAVSGRLISGWVSTCLQIALLMIVIFLLKYADREPPASRALIQLTKKPANARLRFQFPQGRQDAAWK
jgi:hypothetical protein